MYPHKMYISGLHFPIKADSDFHNIQWGENTILYSVWNKVETKLNKVETKVSWSMYNLVVSVNSHKSFKWLL